MQVANKRTFALILLIIAFSAVAFPDYIFASGTISYGDRMIVWAILVVGSVIVWTMPSKNSN